MNIIGIALIIFVMLETLNILTLYFNPGSKMGNGIGVFKAWNKTQKDPEVASFVKYLVYWVAGTKLIFIFLIVIILIFGDDNLQAWAVLALILSILSFFWRLYPMIRKMDKDDQINPPGYSKTLGIMIAIFVLGFMIVFLVEGISIIIG